jgi:excisionase family DNA binding protein
MTVTIARRLYRASEVAQLLGVTTKRVRELAESGELPSVRLSGTGWHRFRAEDVERLIAGERQP